MTVFQTSTSSTGDVSFDDPNAESLDPKSWSAAKALGHRMVDEMMDYLRGVRERPVWQPMSEEAKRSLQAPVPRRGADLEDVYEVFASSVRPYPHGNIHPRFWGWVVGTGTPGGMLAEMLAAGVNSNAGFGDNGTARVEVQVIDWLKEIFGFSTRGGGLLVSGCSMANLTALTVARNAMSGVDVRQDGLGEMASKMTVYGSCETHSSNHRALELLGLGCQAFRAIGVGDDFRIDVAELRETLIRDRDEGRMPFCVIGNLGTVNNGAIDDLHALADVCEEFDLWFHVDGAFGALLGFSTKYRHLLSGVEKADSLAFDLHKWLHVPYEAGGILVRDRAAHHASFKMSGAYLSPIESRLASGPLNFMEHSPQMSRSARAIKAWFTIKEHGVDKIGRMMERNIEQARYLEKAIDAREDLELLAPVPMNIVCFRYRGGGLGEEGLNALNQSLVSVLQEGGVVAPSHTVIDGRFCLRVAITNHRSRFEDFDVLIDEVVKGGERLAQK